MKKSSILKHNLMRAAMTLALIMTCAVAWAQPRMQTFTKEIRGYGNDNHVKTGWYLIASPIGEVVNPENVYNMIANTYDLYYFDQTGGNNGKEWKNWKNEEGDGYLFNLEPGKGYLYANSEDVTLQFIGTPYNDDSAFELEYSGDNPDENMHGWNLVGNPFNAEVNVDRDFFRLGQDSPDLIPGTAGTTVEAMEGIFVKATEPGQFVTFTPVDESAPANNDALMVMNLSQNRGSVIDRAIVRFGESHQLPKLQIFENGPKLYIPQGGEEYAIAFSNGYGEIPVNFKATKNGEYTITVNPEGVEMGYLHLIDNMTGADVDLLASPEYTFNARTTDYESRFKLVFVSEDANDNDDVPFAFISNGSIIVNGEGTLQVIDMMGRVVVSIDGHTRCVPTAEMVPGVYVLRLINGENVRTQKMVIE